MLYRLPARLVGIGLLIAGGSLAAEYAVLQTGSRLRVERHEAVGDRIRLRLPEGGTIELAASAIEGFEPDDMVPAAPAATPPPAEDVETTIEKLGVELGLPAALIHSVVAAESAYNPSAVSSKGAVGLMQLMPETARELQVTDSLDPVQNLRGGTAYLKQLLERYDGRRDQLVRALAAYNAGPEKVDHYGGLPPYNETRLFVGRVIQRFLRLTEGQAANGVAGAMP
jgi:soluble lytic murein transglycosylase-like protein